MACVTSACSPLSRAPQRSATSLDHNFGTGTRGFAAPEDLKTAVCLLPGTELAFSKEVTFAAAGMFPSSELTMGQTVAIFRQINKEQPRTHHDALDFPDGRIVLLTMLGDGQEAMVLQVPAQPRRLRLRKKCEKRVVYVG